MIFITVKFTVRPEHSDNWLAHVEDFTRATRNEPGNVFFEWSRSVDDPNQFVLLEGFASPQAGEEHVNSAHFQAAMASIPEYIATTPDIINVEIPGDGFSKMAELAPRNA